MIRQLIHLIMVSIALTQINSQALSQHIEMRREGGVSHPNNTGIDHRPSEYRSFKESVEQSAKRRSERVIDPLRNFDKTTHEKINRTKEHNRFLNEQNKIQAEINRLKTDNIEEKNRVLREEMRERSNKLSQRLEELKQYKNSLSQNGQHILNNMLLHDPLKSDPASEKGNQIRELLDAAAQAYDHRNSESDNSDIKYAMELLVKADKLTADNEEPFNDKKIARLIRNSQIVISYYNDMNESIELRREIIQESAQAVETFNLKYKQSTNGDFYLTGPNDNVTSLDYIVADTASQVLGEMIKNDRTHFFMSALLQNAQQAIPNSHFLFNLNMENAFYLYTASLEGFSKGFVQRTFNLVTGVVDFVIHPIDSTEALVEVVRNYKETWLAIKYSVLTHFRDIGEAHPIEQARYMGEFSGKVAIDVMTSAGIAVEAAKIPQLVVDVGKIIPDLASQVYNGMKVVQKIKARNMGVLAEDVGSISLNAADFYVTPKGNVIPYAEVVTKEQYGVSVLGRYPRYIELADEIGARRFNIPSPIASTMTEEQLWTANVKFLDRLSQRGDNVRLSVNYYSNEAKSGIYLMREIDYLLERGYKISDDGLWLIKTKQ